MQKPATILIFFFLLPLGSFARQISTVADTVSYDTWISKGISELNRHNGVRASISFRKALQLRENDQDALEHLYSSLLLSGDAAESRVLAGNYSPAFREKLGVPAKRLIISAFLDAGYVMNPRMDSLKAFKPDGALAQTYLLPSYSYFSFGLNLEPGTRFTASLSANVTSFPAIQQFIIRNQIPLEFEVPYDQRGLCLSGSYYAGKGFQILLGGQIMAYTLPLYQWTRVFPGLKYTVGGYEYRDIALHASVIKRFPYVTVSAGGDVNRLRNLWYKQAEADVTLYPAGNINTWLKLGVYWQPDSIQTHGNFVSFASAGRKLFKNVWIEGAYYHGDIRNFSENQAGTVLHNLDLITKRVGVSLMVYRLLPHLDLSLKYQYNLRVASWQIYENYTYFEDQKENYPVHCFQGGLIWRF